MARRRNTSRHHRRGRFAFLRKMLSILVICGVVILAMTLFFRVDAVVATGQVRYSAEEICEASGVKEGDNLYLLNKYDVSSRIRSALPYIEDIRINRKLPDTLLIEVTECGTPLALEQEGIVWIISSRGQIVDQKTPEEAEGYGTITGCELLAPSVGTEIALVTEYSVKEESLRSLLTELNRAGMLEKVDGIRLEDLSTLYLDYDGRFTVKLPYGADYAFKLRALRSYLEDTDVIQENMTGTFDMQTDEDQTYFKPNVR